MRRVGGNTNPVAPGTKLHYDREHGIDGIGVEAHLRLLDYHPVQVVATGHSRWRQEVAKSEQKRDELPLPCRADQIWQHGPPASKHDAPLHPGDLCMQLEATEHMLGKWPAERLVQAVGLWKKDLPVEPKSVCSS